jgi:hypothetical protein
MRALAPAAGMQRRGRGLQRNRKEGSGERKQQQKFCGQALHVFR